MKLNREITLSKTRILKTRFSGWIVDKTTEYEQTMRGTRKTVWYVLITRARDGAFPVHRTNTRKEAEAWAKAHPYDQQY